MNILIINQPTGNRGDESAHKALIRSLIRNLKDKDCINVAFFGEPKKATLPFVVKDDKVNYTFIDSSYGKCRVPIVSFKYGIADILCTILPAYRRMNTMIKSADYVICAPGGICMGKFMNWDHIFWLSRAKRYGKKLAYFSRSFGPFNKGGKYDSLFEEESLKLLRYCSIISIRDKRTMSFAESLHIPFIPSIDAAFLDYPKSTITLSDFGLKSKQYVVFVPNSLTWQPSYKNVKQEDIDDLHLHVIDNLVKKYPGYKIVMMPQLFGQESNSDYQYFNVLRKKAGIGDDTIVILDDTVNSDTQQMIIRNSSFVIGGRYHSIVFSINNQTPFISLSYEDKMFGLLSILQLEDRQIDMRKFQTQIDAKDELMQNFNILFSKGFDFELSLFTEKAKKIANNSIQQLLMTFK